MSLTHLDANLAGSLNIRTIRKSRHKYGFTPLSKEVTIGLLDGKNANSVDVVHIDRSVDLNENVETRLLNYHVSLY